jgi:ABC-2 type transport system ATP-binding protein
VDEIQNVLTDVMFINRGRIVLNCTMEDFESRYLELMVNPEHLPAARALKPIHEHQVLGRSILLFDLESDLKTDLKSDQKLGLVDRQQLAALGDVRTPSIADLFVAVLGNTPGSLPGQGQGAAI